MSNLNASIAFNFDLAVGTLFRETGRVSIELSKLVVQQKARLLYTPEQSTNLTISIDKSIVFNYDKIEFVDKDRWVLPLLLNFVLNTETAKQMGGETLRGMIETLLNQLLDTPVPKVQFMLPMSTTTYDVAPVVLD